MLGLSTKMCRDLLMKFQWNPKTVIDSFVSDDNFLKKTFNISLDEIAKAEKEAGQQKGDMLCLCCYMEVPPKDTVGIECGHRLCKDCYKGYLESMVRDGPECIFATCPLPKCKLLVDPAIFKKLLNSKDYNRYS